MKKKVGLICVVLTILLTVYAVKHSLADTYIFGNKVENKKTNNSDEKTKKSKAKAQNRKNTKRQIDWRKPSEAKPYPALHSEDKIIVDTDKQRVYIERGNEIIYTMYCSTGSKDSPTPKGEFEIQEKGANFYNSKTGEGANYYVSFKDHGVYLFHSVPVDKNGNYIVSEADKLGEEANSHGCVRLSVPDAKWFYENITEGTKVIVN